ncbi:serine hydrolase domain-containing protein [Nocardiopsis potens]|uniref:serine hydrolase domain-containing protein n=1 Tax=Nocardiopsis potens TaxID=1246458 RepID=UPI0003463BBC|nr:serine hydrolase domain-containing protein [Nocardiopsis potens]
MRTRLRRLAAVAAALPLFLLSGPPAPPAEASTGNGRYAELDAYVRDRMQATGTPGLAYAVVGPDGPVHRRAWGTDGRGGPVTADTPFLWGSVAKPAAASSVLVLAQEGRLGLDDPVTDHLPDFRFGGPGHASRVTVGHLLAQTAGLPASATFAVADCLDPDCPGPAERIGALDDVRPLGPPGTAYAYTSANYLVLAAVVESVTGRPFADHLKESVLEPAGMTGAIADRASAAERGLAPGHQPMWGVPAPIADGMDGDGAAYGYLGGDLDDLAAFAAFQLRSGRTAEGEAVLTPESVRLMRTEGELDPSGEGTGYGLGWRVGGLDAPLDGAVWHTGASPGYSAMLFLLPEQDTALVLQQNLHGLIQDGAVMEAGFGAARILAGGPAPADAPSAAGYHAAVWGCTALAAALALAAGRSALLLRRPAPAASRARRAAAAALHCLAGAVPCAALAAAAAKMGPGPLVAWLPDTALALCAAAAAGAALIAVGLLRALRPGPGTGRAGAR